MGTLLSRSIILPTDVKRDRPRRSAETAEWGLGRNFCDCRALFAVVNKSQGVLVTCRSFFAIHSWSIRNAVALLGIQFTPVSVPECEIFIFVSNQAQFSFIRHKVVPHFSHFLTNGNNWEGFKRPATTLWLFWEKICRALSLNMFRIPAPEEWGLVTHANVSLHFRNSRANAVCNLSPTVTVQ